MARPQRARRRRADGRVPLAAGRRRRPAQHQRVARSRRPPRSSTRCAAALAGVEWHRYPDRGAARAAGPASPSSARRRAAEPGLRRQRLQRGAADAVPHLRRRRPHGRRCSSRPTRCTPTSPASPAPRSPTGDAPRRLHPRPRRGAARGRAPSRPTITFLCSPNNPTGMVESEATGARGARRWSRRSTGCSSSTRPTASSRRGRRSSSCDDDRPLVVTRTYSKTWSMAAARASAT